MPSDSQRLARAVIHLTRRLRRERLTELTPTQLSVLGTVMELGSATPGTVAAREGVSPPSVTRTLNCLVDDGYVLRDPHPDDRRQVLVSLSDKGAAMLQEQRARRNAWLDARMAKLTADERATLRKASDLLDQLSRESE